MPWTDAYEKMHCYGDSVFTLKPWLEAGLDPTTLANSYLVECAYCARCIFRCFEEYHSCMSCVDRGVRA